MSFYCLVNPHSGVSEKEMEKRADSAIKATSLLLKQGVNVLSLNAHNTTIKNNSEMTQEEYKEICLRFSPSVVKESKGIIVLTLDGWDASNGVKMEIDTAKKYNLSIYYLSMKDIEENNNKVKELL